MYKCVSVINAQMTRSRGRGKRRYQEGTRVQYTEENQIGRWVGQEGEQTKSYSTAVIDGTKRNSRIYVGDSIVRKPDTRLSRGGA